MRPFDLFFDFSHGQMDGPTGILSIEMLFYLSVIFLGFFDKIHEEKPSFLVIENNWTDRPTD